MKTIIFCGSMELYDQMCCIAIHEIRKGNSVILPINFRHKFTELIDGNLMGMYKTLTENHCNLISTADEVWVLHENEHFGYYTRIEMEKAKELKKPIKKLTFKWYLKKGITTS